MAFPLWAKSEAAPAMSVTAGPTEFPKAKAGFTTVRDQQGIGEHCSCREKIAIASLASRRARLRQQDWRRSSSVSLWASADILTAASDEKKSFWQRLNAAMQVYCNRRATARPSWFQRLTCTALLVYVVEHHRQTFWIAGRAFEPHGIFLQTAHYIRA